ncbi:MAG TPA: zinc-binding alcohol dehydrogenase [Amycolatopsis sp.]|uniref:zinc-dependent alcohol dehydrogenase n=1 Tax=Amycolatopsis sp. TaxID=37632 RepID=UPI002B48CB3F|nr:zinc-binding alcohol dehydrogenase [Amycolatopsis sp.]HJQ48789.1 zinc-binding alcohol dehydrogenase [Amycolatopsis sp.]HKS50209.1 zinc-binding alcohol dehydrogenase [Amycolatopsis sp.]
MTATAVWFNAPRSVELRPSAVRPPAEGEIQVRGLCALISVGSEMNLYRGEGDLPDLSMFPTAEGRLPFPVKFGYQEVGEVEAVGPGARFEVGDRVFCFHPHQTRFTISAELVWKIPPELDPERAAFAGLFGVALNACITTPPLVGDCVVVSGLGVIGTFAGYLARLTAGNLVLVEPSATRRRKSEWIGADAVVHPDEAASAVEELSAGRGADLFIEASGAPPALQQALRLTGVEATVTVASWYGTRPVSLSLSPEFHLRRQKVVSTGPALPAHLAPRWDRARMRRVSFAHLARLDVSTLLVTHRVPFDHAPDAYALLDDPAADTLAVLLEHR